MWQARAACFGRVAENHWGQVAIPADVDAVHWQRGVRRRNCGQEERHGRRDSSRGYHVQIVALPALPGRAQRQDSSKATADTALNSLVTPKVLPEF